MFVIHNPFVCILLAFASPGKNNEFNAAAVAAHSMVNLCRDYSVDHPLMLDFML